MMRIAHPANVDFNHDADDATPDIIYASRKSREGDTGSTDTKPPPAYWTRWVRAPALTFSEATVTYTGRAVCSDNTARCE